ncbi:MAG TPA: hypothetical protein VFZ15_10085 [Acidimicrobiia bacterium]|nr:hypothetical protein [Acidimicrobiia bacterium]
MFLTPCDRLGREVLIWASDLHGITNTEAGIVLRFRCACGDVAELLTGATAPVRISAHLADLSV